MPLKPAHLLFTLLLALAGAGLCVFLHTPLPWMIGALLASACATVAGAPTAGWRPLSNAGQWVIGSAMGLYFTPQVTALVASLWWAIVLAIAWAIGLGWVFGSWLHRVNAPRMTDVSAPAMRATSYFAGAIGGAAEMTMLAEREHGRSDLVAASHSLRLVLVTLTVPVAMQFSGLHGLDLHPPVLRAVNGPGLAGLMLATGVGGWLMMQLRGVNPWFLGPLLVTMAFTMSGIQLSGMPQWLTNAAQLSIGMSLGVRFTRVFLRAAPRWMASVIVGTLGMIALCCAFAWLLAWTTGLPMATLILGTSPGGIAEMAITAKVLQLGVPVVTVFQVCRLVAVLLLVAPLFRRLYPGDPPALAAPETVD
jgi:membrane AbrB-like protein